MKEVPLNINSLLWYFFKLSLSKAVTFEEYALILVLKCWLWIVSVEFDNKEVMIKF